MKAANTPSCKTAMTYGEIAAKIAAQKGLKQMSAKAVGEESICDETCNCDEILYGDAGHAC